MAYPTEMNESKILKGTAQSSAFIRDVNKDLF